MRNDSLTDLIALLEAEVERLKVDLETFRLTQHPSRERIVRELVDQIDARQDRLEELEAIRREQAGPDAGSAPEVD
ncbi:MAG: hypothetical protein AAGI15_04090 [Pseudomonadota bacterium]